MSDSRLHLPQVALALLCVVGGIAGFERAHGAQRRYLLLDLGSLGGDTEPQGLTDALPIRVVGVSNNPAGDQRAFLWLPEPDYGLPAGINDLGTLPGGLWSVGYAINDSGTVVGYSHAELPYFSGTIFRTHAFRWTPGSGMVDILAPFVDTTNFYSYALDINNAGQIAGYHIFPDQDILGYRLTGGSLVDFQPPAGHDETFATAINDTGTVAGYARPFEDPVNARAAVWSGGGTRVLGTLGGTYSEAHGINNLSEVVGVADTGGGVHHAFHAPLTLMTDLGVTGGLSEALDFNDAVQIAGFIELPPGSGTYQAAMWDNGFLNLLSIADSGWTLRWVRAINRTGHIVGAGYLGGNYHGVLLSPTAIELLDPNPKLLDGPEVTADLDKLGVATGNDVDGLAADGATRVVLRMKGFPAPGTVRFSIYDENDQVSLHVGFLSAPGSFDLAGEVLVPVTTLATGEYAAFAVLYAPSDFVRTAADEPLSNRIIKVHAEYTTSQGAAAPVLKQDVELRRPPVMLIHGLWSSRDTWKWPLKDDPRFTVYREDYMPTHADHFLTNAHKPRTGVASAVQMMREQRIAATRADVFGHSMGGLLSRLFIGGLGPKHIRDDNFGRGDVHKLVTVDSPHLGSPLASLLVTSNGNATLIGRAFNLAKMYTDRGAVFDLRPDSPITTSFPAANVPAHAIVGKGGSDIIQQGAELLIPRRYRIPLNILQAFGVLEDLFPPSLQHDLIVGRISQEGGLSGTHTSVFGLTFIPPRFAIHTTMPQESRVGDRAIVLLNTTAQNANTFAGGFPPAPVPRGSDPHEPGAGPQFRLAGGGGVQITSPSSGTIVTPGATFQVLAEGYGGFVPVRVLFLCSDSAETDEEAPFDTMLEVAPEGIGELRVSAIGFDAGENVAFSEEVVLTVDVPAALTGISVVPDTVYLFNFGPTHSLTVLGAYDDGIERELTPSSLGTVYASSNPYAATVDAEGIVSGRYVGETVVTVSHGPYMVDVPVKIMSAGGDFEKDGDVDSTDLAQFPACFTGPGGVLAPEACEAMDFDVDQDVDLVDFAGFQNRFTGDADCDGDGFSNSTELASGLSADANTNGVPDECEDCNTNGVFDDVDIAMGTSQDCDGDGRPDECQPDCNANGQADACDISQGGSMDVNLNGVPDECDPDCNNNGVVDDLDIANQTSGDCNSNVVPDECEFTGPFTVGSPQLVPLDFYHPHDYRITAPPRAYGNVTLNFVVRGDIASTSERVNVSLNGVSIGPVYEGVDPSCLAGVVDSLTLAAAAYNAAVGGGDAVITMAPSNTVRWLTCFGYTNSNIQVTVSYTAYTADCDGNGVFDECDLLSGADTDCNGNGIPDGCEPDCNANGAADECDIFSGTSLDCNADGMPDECEPDCNANDIADACDIAFGVSADCNVNDIPDDCESDCNTNGIQDDCEFPHVDCNRNGIWDGCEFLTGTSLDCNNNGLLDECDIVASGIRTTAIVDLGEEFRPEGLNDQGQVVGYREATGHATRWQSGVYTDLGTLGGGFSGAAAVNEPGQIVGNSELAVFAYHAFHWQSGSLTDLGTLGGLHSYALDINDQGQIVGQAYDAAGRSHAVLWNGGPPQALEQLGLSGDSAQAINESGQIVGTSNTYGGTRRAVRWDGGSLTNLGTLAGPGALMGPRSSAADINSFGRIVGTSDKYRSTSSDFFDNHAFLWEDGAMFDLGGLGTSTIVSSASAIDDLRRIVGQTTYYGTPNWTMGGFASSHPFLWQNNVMTDLNNVLPGVTRWELESATGINEIGQVTGIGFMDAQFSPAHGYLLTVIPNADCNRNGLLDSCEISGGTAQDCNANGVPDECDLSLIYTTPPSPQLGPLHSGSPQARLFTAPPAAYSAVTLSFICNADIGAANQNVAISINGTGVGTVFDSVYEAFSHGAYDELVVPAAVYNAALAGGNATINMVPSAAVGSGGGTYIRVSMKYVALGFSDCNANAIPDSCDIAAATSADGNGNGIPDECE